MKKLVQNFILIASVLTLSLPVLSKPYYSKKKVLPDPRKVTSEREWKPHVGLLYGIIFPEGDYKTRDSLGVDVGFQPFIPFGIGLEYTTTFLEANEGGGSFNRNDLLAKFSYNFGGDISLIKNSYVGLGLGAAFTRANTDLVTAPLLGFDIPFAHTKGDCYFSLGANAKYAFYEDQPDAFTTNAVLKFWF